MLTCGRDEGMSKALTISGVSSDSSSCPCAGHGHFFRLDAALGLRVLVLFCIVVGNCGDRLRAMASRRLAQAFTAAAYRRLARTRLAGRLVGSETPGESRRGIPARRIVLNLYFQFPALSEAADNGNDRRSGVELGKTNSWRCGSCHEGSLVGRIAHGCAEARHRMLCWSPDGMWCWSTISKNELPLRADTCCA